MSVFPGAPRLPGLQKARVRLREHRPVAVEEAHLMLIEPTGTPNTGNAETAAQRRVI